MDRIERRPIDFAEGYAVSADGRVWSRKKRGKHGLMHDYWHELMPFESKGRKRVRLSLGTFEMRVYVHILVAHYFIGERPKGARLVFKDGDLFNPSLDNLEYKQGALC